MKTQNLLAAILMIFIVLANTNRSQAQEIAIGIKAGPNLANIIDLPSDFPSGGTGLGAHIGPFIKIPITENFSIQPELLFSIKGTHQKDEILGISYEATTGLSYIEIPLMANYQLDNGLNFELGPYFGLLLAAKSKVEVFGFSETVDIKEEMESLDIGLGVGIGYRLENGLGFGLRYAIGLTALFPEQDVVATDLFGDPIIDPSTNLPMIIKQDAYGKNSNIMVSVSWLFGQN